MKMTVEELRQRMTFLELLEWAEYDEIERKRIEKIDYYGATLCALTESASSGKKTPISKFFLATIAKGPLKLSSKQMAELFDGLVAHGMARKKESPDDRYGSVKGLPGRGRHRLDKRNKPSHH